MIVASEHANEGGLISPTYTFTIVVTGAPVFTIQPLPHTVNVGQTVVFTAAASGSPTYQWTL